MTKNFKPAGFATLSPYLTVQDVQKAYEFYERAFGFTLRGEPSVHEGRVVHVEMFYHDATIMLGQEGAFNKESKAPKSLNICSPMSLYLYCEDVEMLCAQAIKAGAEVIMPVQTMFWGDRMCKLKDIEGYEWCFATHSPQHTHGHGCC
jgi:uncharacterized glyoxalase superfamily protein PhnB